MATDLSIIKDNTAFTLTNSNRISMPWTSAQSTTMYNSTSWHASNGSGSFDFFFEGTSVAFTGVLPTSSSQRPTVQIDNRTVVSINYNDSSYRQWYQSPKLSNGFHAISVTCLKGTYLDFAVVNVGNHTSIIGQTVIVDDDSSSVYYSGHWSWNTSGFEHYAIGKGYPYGNSTHRSSTPGDTFTFRFIGTSVSVYGIFSQAVPGTLSATFGLDGTLFNRTYNGSNSFPRREADSPNFLFFSLDNLAPDEHALIVNITAAKNQTFALDYITYTPSFETLSSMPDFRNTTPLTGSTPVGHRSSHRPPTAGIVGGVVGGLALITALGVGVWLFLRRRKAKKTEMISQYLYTPTTEANHQNDANHIPNKQMNLRQLRLLRPLRPLRPVKPGRLDSVETTGCSPSGPSGSTDQRPHNPRPRVAADPPPYDTLSSIRHITPFYN